MSVEINKPVGDNSFLHLAKSGRDGAQSAFNRFVDSKLSHNESLNMEEKTSLPRLVSLTPRLKTTERTLILIECHESGKEYFHETNNNHTASMKHRNLIINKEASQGMTEVVKRRLSEDKSGHVSLEFFVFLINARTSERHQESRKLRFWLQDSIKDQSFGSQVTQDFFKELVNPNDFPKGIKQFP